MLTALKNLSMNMCEYLEALQDSIVCLDYLQSLSNCHCPKLERLPALPPSLASVDARNCVALQSVCSSKVVPEVWNCSHHINGNEIITWFEHRLEESSINVTPSSNKFDDTFIGFVFCVVVDFKDCNLDGDFKIYYEATFSFPDGSKTTWCHTWIWHWNHHRSNNERDESRKKENGTTEIACRSVNSPHVFLFYDNGRQRRENSSNCQVKSCGIWPLYSHDIRYLGCLSQDDEESAGEDSEKSVVAGDRVEEIAQEDEEESEQHLHVNEPDLQMNKPRPEENDEKNLTFCCLELRSRLLEFCDRSGTRSSGRLHGGLRNDMRRETSNLRVNPSQSVAVQQWPISGCNQLLEELVKLRYEYREINQRLDHLIMMQSSPSRQFNTQPQGISSGGSRND
ncbi:hypothetical protein TIFTF001_032009 [Ficus carica]|uniref:C-JID domain-containing protein n=1 Tax=Ficus carica TaxID=3494 RepID=A0AA88DVN3_FICCA|nr:hypothetical protein TIFTF001_031965 [Ficus carica]GMN62927.1 hypothetical protein TIFTF001_032009 [Ficus carica]